MRHDHPPLSLYVHWPFCRSKCPYCDFNSHVREAIDEDGWRAALIAELGLNLLWSLETHVHADHVTGGWLMKQRVGCQIALAEASGATGAESFDTVWMWPKTRARIGVPLAS